MTHRLPAVSVLGCLACLFGSTVTILSAAEPATGPTSPAEVKPSPAFKPGEVVKIQIDALRENDEKNSGIATCFRFASPDNQKQTGPVERFAVLCKTPPYDKLIGFTEARFSPMKTEEDGRRTQLVVLKAGDGSTAGFVFILSKQTDGEYKDCWMTDGVVPVQPADENDEKPV